MSKNQRKVLLISHDIVGRQMAGPGIRYYRLALVLAQHVDLRLAAPWTSDNVENAPFADLTIPNGEIIQYRRGDWSSISRHVDWADVVILPSDTANDFPELASKKMPLVIDGYNPLIVEFLALHGEQGLVDNASGWQSRMQMLQPQYEIGDFYICASERQRDWWLGLLEAQGRINPWTYNEDPSFRSLIDVVPYGLPDAPPQKTRPVVKGSWPGIGQEDRLILWGGGLWLWLDPLTAIRAVAQVWQHRQDVKLLFPGTRHPNPSVANSASHYTAAKVLAAELGLLDRAIFFGDWLPYEDWPNVLLESDVALSLHFDTIETRLAFRSRILEYIWAGVPSIVSKGDATSDLIAKYELGLVVDFGDVNAVAKGLQRLLETQWVADQAFDQARDELRWEKIASPLLNFCLRPRQAADRMIPTRTSGNPAWGNRCERMQQLNLELTQTLAEMELEREQQRALIHAYEQGYFMRSMRWMHKQKYRLKQTLDQILK